jgi:DNA polymerase
MSHRPPLSLEQSLAAAQAWWREAGVDLAFVDEPSAWLDSQVPQAAATPAAKPVPPTPERPAAPQIPPLGGDPERWPSDLALFRRWWLDEPTLDEGGLYPRVPPRGEAGAALMVIVPMPEAEDTDTLLSGPHGRLIGSMVSAMGLANDQVYWAATLPRHASVPGWSALAERGLGRILLHHVQLASPARVMTFGRGILSLLGHDPAQGAPSLSKITIDGRQVSLLAAYAPERLLDNYRQRASLWQRWLDWTDQDG